MPAAVLEELKKYPVQISTVASMLESGGSSGQLRIDFNILPSGDLRRQFLALSDAPVWKKELFKFRLGREMFDDTHRGHSFGNVFISGLEYILKDFRKALQIVHHFLEVKGEVLPATVESGHIYAILENGDVIFGEDEIDVPRKHNPKLKIREVLLASKVKAYLPTLKAVGEADCIIVGPGDLYSSLVPCFLPSGMREALKKSKAKKVLICNAMTKLGETNNFSVLDFAKETEKYMGCELDFVLYNTKILDKKRIQEYRKEHPELLDVVKIDPSINTGQAKKKFIGTDLLVKSGPLVYDSKKVVKTLMNLM